MKKGRKNDSLKLRMDLIPPEVEEIIAGVLTYGSLKFDDNNWKNNLDVNRIYGALRRHLSEYRKDKDSIDPETAMLHIDHALCNMVFLVWYAHKDDGDDGGADWTKVIKRWRWKLNGKKETT